MCCLSTLIRASAWASLDKARRTLCGCAGCSGPFEKNNGKRSWTFLLPSCRPALLMRPGVSRSMLMLAKEQLCARPRNDAVKHVQ